ncbi:hypothetical protein ACS0TY_021499 [Phlomoides rotata]
MALQATVLDIEDVSYQHAAVKEMDGDAKETHFNVSRFQQIRRPKPSQMTLYGLQTPLRRASIRFTATL